MKKIMAVWIALYISLSGLSLSQANAQSAASAPTRLQIPALKIDAAIQSVGKDKSGNMDVPNNSLDVAWYNLGPAPGAQGNAVISGHYDDSKGPAVFYRLGKLKIGDTISVINTDGSQRDFRVIEVASYPYTKAPIAKIFGFDFEHDLNLITCGGRWNSRTHTYNQRLVIYTRLIKNATEQE